MKSIQNKHTIQKKLILVIVAAILLVFITGYYLYSKHNNPSTGSSTSIQSDNDKLGDNPVKDTNGKGAETPSTLPNNSQMITTNDVPVNETASASITRLEQKDSTIYFDANIVGASELGRCVVSFSTPNDKPISKEFDAKLVNGQYVCSLTTSALEFSYLGDWEVTLRYYYNQTQVTTKGTIKIS